MIVGFDPGTVSALAGIDLEGKLLFSQEFRGGVKAAVNIISKEGRPSVVASDKSYIESSDKLASSFGALAFFPDKDLSQEEKADLIRDYPVSGRHESDALAAALYALKHYKSLIRRVKARENEIFRKLLKNELANISDALEPEPESEDGRVSTKRKVELRRRVKDLRRRLRLANQVIDEKDQLIEELRARPVERHTTVVDYSDQFEDERRARIRLEKELLEAHGRLSRIESLIDRHKTSGPEGKRDIRARIVDLIQDYKERFSK